MGVLAQGGAPTEGSAISWLGPGWGYARARLEEKYVAVVGDQAEEIYAQPG